MAGTLVQHPEMAEYAKKLRAQGFGFRLIAKKLHEEFNFKISHMGIKTYFDGIDLHAPTTTSAPSESLKEEILNTAKQLKKINKEMWQLYTEIKEEGKDKFGIARMNMLDKILRQLEFNARQLGRITSATVNITQINYVDFAVTISNYLKKWEEQGYIKILKPISPKTDEE